jgi:hypothetical protein
MEPQIMLSAILAHGGTQLTTVEKQMRGVDRAVVICIAILQTGIVALFLVCSFSSLFLLLNGSISE